MTKSDKKERIWELDFLRGFAILMMVFDHIMFDLSYFPGYFSNFYQLDIPVFNWLQEHAVLYWNSGIRFFGRHFFIFIFLFVSGISFTFSHNNVKRGLKMLVVAFVITLSTYLMDITLGYDVLIIFGVIHMFAINTLLTALIRKWIKSEIIVLFIGMVLLTISFIFGFFEPQKVSLSWSNLPGIIIGLKAYGADHFGVLPYLGFIIIGTVIGKLFYQHKVSLLPKQKLSHQNIILLTGRYSLWVYVLHQPVVLVIVMAIAYLFGYRV